MIANFKKKKSNNVFLHFVLQCGLFLVLALIILLVVADVKIYKKKHELNSQIESLKNKIEDLNNEAVVLRQGISDSGEQEYIEQVAREELDLQKPGEKVVSFITADNGQSEKNVSQKGVFQAWFAWVSNIFKWD